MAVLNINWLSKALRSSPIGRKLFVRGIGTILYILEGQKLLDWRKLQEVSIDWEKGVISAGDDFTDQIIGRAISEYIINRKKNKIYTMIAAENRKPAEAKR